MMGMFGGGGRPQPKGDISQLWKLLGVEMYGDEIVWQEFNPGAQDRQHPNRSGCSSTKAWPRAATARSIRSIPNDEISAGMRQVLFLSAGSFRPADGIEARVHRAGRHRTKQRHDQLSGLRHVDAHSRHEACGGT